MKESVPVTAVIGETDGAMLAAIGQPIDVVVQPYSAGRIILHQRVEDRDHYITTDRAHARQLARMLLAATAEGETP